MKRLLALFLALTMTLGMAACSSESSATSVSGASAQAGEGSTESAKDSITIGVSSEFSQYVPLSSNTAVANRDGLMIFALYDPLIWRDPYTGELESCVAKEWSVSEDGLEYTLYLRDDVTFHDGTPLTAEDVAWTLNLLPECPTVSVQNYPGFSHAEAVDDYTVKVYLDKPFAAMLNGLAAYHVVCLSKDYFDKVGWEGYVEHPIGTGPYKFVNHEQNSHLELEAYDDYWGETAAIDSVKFLFLPDSNSQIMSLENGEIDLLYNPGVQNAERISNTDGLTWSWCEASNTCVLNMSLTKDGVMQDENFRKAILSAIDYDGINEAINLGYTKMATCLLPPGTTGRPDDGTYTDPLGHDEEKAKEYLAQSDYAEGTPVRMICLTGSREEQILTIILGNLQEIGIAAELIPVDGANYMSTLMAGNYEISLYSMMPSLFDGQLLCQQYDPTQASWDLMDFPEKDEMGELALSSVSEMDSKARKEIFAKMTSIINEKAYAGYLYYDVVTIAYNENLKNIQPASSSNIRITEWSW